MTPMSGLSETTDSATTGRAWHGPPSVVGVVVGLLVGAVGLLAQQDGLWVLFVLPPVLGLLMLAGGTTVRQLGVGLLASGLAYPIALGTFLLIGLLG